MAGLATQRSEVDLGSPRGARRVVDDDPAGAARCRQARVRGETAAESGGDCVGVYTPTRTRSVGCPGRYAHKEIIRAPVENLGNW